MDLAQLSKMSEFYSIWKGVTKQNAGYLGYFLASTLSIFCFLISWNINCMSTWICVDMNLPQLSKMSEFYSIWKGAT